MDAVLADRMTTLHVQKLLGLLDILYSIYTSVGLFVHQDCSNTVHQPSVSPTKQDQQMKSSRVILGACVAGDSVPPEIVSPGTAICVLLNRPHSAHVNLHVP